MYIDWLKNFIIELNIILSLNFSKGRVFNMKDTIGYIFIVAGVADFLLGNFGGMNLTGFMGSLSSFSPIILIVVGGLLTRAGKK